MNKDALSNIISLLNKSNLKEQADDLEDLGAQYYTVSKEKKQEIGYKIKQMCHPKWLGDFYINGVSQKEWFNLLDRLSKSV